MNILFDISVLGLGTYVASGRTGIARAIECLAVELNRLAPGELGLCASHSVPQLLQTLTYLRGWDQPEGYRFAGPEGRLAQGMLVLLDRIYPKPGGASLLRRVFNRGLTSAAPLLASPGVRELARADLFHSTLYPFPAQVRAAPRLARFLTIYDLIPVRFPQYFQNNTRHLIHEVVAGLAPDDWVVAISQNTKDDLCNCAPIDPERVFVTPLAASGLFFPCTDAARIEAVRATHGIPVGPYVLSLSTLEPRKNVDQTVRSFVDLVRQQGITDLSLVLVGTKGWDFEGIFAEIGHAAGLRERIVVTGYVDDVDLAAIYSGALMFVYPSLYEGFGLPPLEAMQCGVPVITSNTSSLPEVVGDAGVMVDPRDQDALTQAMYDLYCSEARRADLAVRGLERAGRFSWQACAEATLGAYRSALG